MVQIFKLQIQNILLFINIFSQNASRNLKPVKRPARQIETSLSCD